MSRNIRTAISSIIFLILLSVIASCASPQSTTPVSAGDIEAFRTSLGNNHCSSRLIPFINIDLIRAYEAGRLSSAAGNNASAPYKTIFANIPDNVEIKSAEQLVNAQQTLENLEYNTPGQILGWQLKPDEAVVLVGKTPPECAYFSYTGFIFYKYYENEKQRKWIWTSFNDPLNNLTIKTSGTPDGAPGNPFNQDTIIIIAADRGTDQRIRSAAIAAGFPESIINTYIIPSSMVKLGIGPEFDTLVVGHRMALFTNQEAGETYAKAVSVAIKVTPDSPTKLDPFPAPELRVRGTGKTEVDLQPALDELRQAILAKYSNLTVGELTTDIWLEESYQAVQTGKWAAGESNDTVYLRSDTFTLGDDPDEFAIAYGINHVATGKATYANSVFYGDAGWNGVASIYSTEYEGTAEEYLPGNPLAKYLYVCKFVRSCGSEKTCVAVPTGPGAYGVGLDEPAFIGFRAYLEPATKVGPAYNELLYDRVIKFD